MFDQLPDELKEMIFELNRPWTAQQISITKSKYDTVINDFNDKTQTVYWSYFRTGEDSEEEDEPYSDFDFASTFLNEFFWD